MENRKEVVLLLDHWYADQGGRKKILILIIDVLSNLFDEVHIFNIETRLQSEDLKGRNLQENLRDNVSIETFFINKKIPTSFFGAFFSLFRGVKKTNPVAAVLGGAGPHTNALFALIFRLACGKGKKTIAIEQANSKIILEHQNAIIRFFTIRLFRKIDRVVVVSREMISGLSSFFHMSPEKFEFIYNCIDLEKIGELKNEEIEEKEFYSGKRLIMTACRIDIHQKDIVGLIRAFEVVLGKITNVILIIIGDGPDREIVEREIVSRGIQDSVFLFGYRQNPYKYMSRSDVFVLSSFSEGLPLVLLEAMACGCPVISSDCDFGPREVLEYGKDGLLVPVGDILAMSDALLKMLSDKKMRDDYITRGYARVKYFSKEKTLEEYENLFRKVLSDK
jgi:glycosyltransferase involved in cell wall biosynthesis